MLVALCLSPIALPFSLSHAYEARRRAPRETHKALVAFFINRLHWSELRRSRPSSQSSSFCE